MTLIKTSLLNAIAVAIKMLTMLGINKILAIYVGPAGYATIGNFQNAVQMIAAVGSAAINTGVTKYTAEYHLDEIKQRNLWRTAGTLALAGSILIGGFVTLFSKFFSVWFLNDESFKGVFFLFGLTLIFFVFNTLLLAILNGKKEIKLYIVTNISGSCFLLITSYFMIINFGLYGALLSLAINQSLVFFVTLFICWRTSFFKIRYLFFGIEKKYLIDLSKYAAMALTSVATVPVSHILVRNLLGENFGWIAAGYWEAIWRLSGAYLLFITTTLSVYYLPRISQLNRSKDIKKEIIDCCKLVIPFCIILVILVYSLREKIIVFLYSEDFLGMSNLFLYQLGGDFFKILAWVFSYILVGKALTKYYIVTEVFFSFNFFFLTKLLISNFELQGVVIAHLLNYILYFICMIFIVNRFLNSMDLKG